MTYIMTNFKNKQINHNLVAKVNLHEKKKKNKNKQLSIRNHLISVLKRKTND